MIHYAFWHFMNFIGFRRILYQPSTKGLSMADFYGWEYAPRLEKRDYTDRDFPFQMYRGK